MLKLRHSSSSTMCHIRYMYACTYEIDSFVCMCVVHMYMNTCSYVRMCELGERMCELGDIEGETRRRSYCNIKEPTHHTYIHVYTVCVPYVYVQSAWCVCAFLKTLSLLLS